MKTVSVYQCDYCRKYGKNKTRILQHEERCYYNPRTRSCGTCIHLMDWKCRQGFVFEKLEGKRTPTLRTKCLLYENQDVLIYGPTDDLMYNQTPF